MCIMRSFQSRTETGYALCALFSKRPESARKTSGITSTHDSQQRTSELAPAQTSVPLRNSPLIRALLCDVGGVRSGHLASCIRRLHIKSLTLSLALGIGLRPQILSAGLDMDAPPANSFSGAPQVSGDGRFVVFQSQASNLTTNRVGEHPLGYYVNVYVRDLATGRIQLVSVIKSGNGGGDGHSNYGTISHDGRYVAFQSEAADLVDNDGNDASDIFVRDLETSATRLVSVNRSKTSSANGTSIAPVITPDGRFVAFESEATDLVDSAHEN